MNLSVIGSIKKKDFIRPVCLLDSNDSDHVVDPIILTGWGKISDGIMQNDNLNSCSSEFNKRNIDLKFVHSFAKTDSGELGHGGILDVAIKRLEKEKTRVMEWLLLLKANGRQF